MTPKIKGLTSATEKIFIPLSQLECIKPYTLVGGTALSLQIGTRLSEDLDFMSWRLSKNEKREVDWPLIKKELSKIGNIEKIEIFDLDHVEFRVEGVKISFYANPNYSPVENTIDFLNNIKLADIESIGAMKMEVMLRRSKFRDYYDLYSILKTGANIQELIGKAIKYSGYQLKTKNLLTMLTNSSRFEKDEYFKNLTPIYDVSSKEIEETIRALVK